MANMRSRSMKGLRVITPASPDADTGQPQEKAAQTTRRAADTLPPDKVGLT